MWYSLLNYINEDTEEYSDSETQEEETPKGTQKRENLWDW